MLRLSLVARCQRRWMVYLFKFKCLRVEIPPIWTQICLSRPPTPVSVSRKRRYTETISYRKKNPQNISITGAGRACTCIAACRGGWVVRGNSSDS